MGVQGLTGFVDRLPHALQEVTFTHDAEDKRALVVDGNALAYNIARSTVLAQRPMANTDKLDAHLLQELSVMLACFTRVVVVMDGPSPAWKRSTAQDRLVKQVQLAKHFHAKIANHGWQPVPRAPSAGTTLLPRSLFVHLIHVLLSHDPDRVAVVHCVGEGDAMVAALAKQLGAYALTLDSDFFVYDCQYLPISGWTINTAETSISARLFSRQTLMNELGLSSHAQLCVWASLIGNDYTRHFVNAAHTGGSFGSAAHAVRKAARSCGHDIASCIAAQLLARIRGRGPLSNADAKTFAISAAQYAQQQHEISQVKRAFQHRQAARKQEGCTGKPSTHGSSEEGNRGGYDGDDDDGGGGAGDGGAGDDGLDDGGDGGLDDGAGGEQDHDETKGANNSGAKVDDSRGNASSSSRANRRCRNRRRKNKRAITKSKSKKKHKKRGRGGGGGRRRPPQTHAMASDLAVPASDAASPLKWADIPVPAGILVTASASLHASISTAMHTIDSTEQQDHKRSTRSNTGSSSGGVSRSRSSLADDGDDDGGCGDTKRDGGTGSSTLATAAAHKQVCRETTVEGSDCTSSDHKAVTTDPGDTTTERSSNVNAGDGSDGDDGGRSSKHRVAARLIGVDSVSSVVNAKGDVKLTPDQVWLLLAAYLYRYYLRSRNYLSLVLLVASIKTVHVRHAKTPDHTKQQQMQMQGKGSDKGNDKKEGGSQQQEHVRQTFNVEVKLEGRAEPAVDSTVGVDANISVARFLQYGAAQTLAAALSRAQVRIHPPPIATVVVSSVMYACDAALNHRKLSGPKNTAGRPSTVNLRSHPQSRGESASLSLLNRDHALGWLRELDSEDLLCSHLAQLLGRQIRPPPSSPPSPPPPSSSTSAPTSATTTASLASPTLPSAKRLGAASSSPAFTRLWYSCWLAGALVAVFASHHPVAAKRQAHTLAHLLRALLLPSHIKLCTYTTALDAGRRRLDHDTVEEQSDGTRAGSSNDGVPTPAQLLDDLSAWQLVVQTFAISVAAAPFATALGASRSEEGESRRRYTDEEEEEEGKREEQETERGLHPWLSSQLFDAHAFWAFAHADSCETVGGVHSREQYVREEPTVQAKEQTEEEQAWSLTCGAVLDRVKE